MDTREQTPVLEDIRLQIVCAKQHLREVSTVEMTREAYEAFRDEVPVATLPWGPGLLEGVHILGLRLIPVSGPGSIAYVA
jgi:hypothetical protein